MPLLPDQEEEATALHLIRMYIECVVYDCGGHPALRNFIIIDILLLNYNSFH